MPPHPVGAAEHRRGNRDKRAACLSRPVFRAASSARADCTEKRREPAHDFLGRASLRAAFLLGTFLWRSKEKYLAQPGRKEGGQARDNGQALRTRQHNIVPTLTHGTRSMPRPRHTRLMIRRRKQLLHIHRIEQIILIAELAIDTHLPLLGDDALHLGIA